MKILCFFGLHKWIIKKEKHQVEGHPAGRSSIRIIVRHCDWCNKRERRYKSDNSSHWSEVIFKEGQTLKFNKYE
jgi:hypothetical protein